ncbi:MAG: hypothetical protein AB1646_17575 [Thermodesulfobacteriota bacterium]
MSSYMFRQRCRARGDFRVNEIREFLSLLKAAFHWPAVYDSRSKVVDLSEKALRETLVKKTDKLFPGIGASLSFFSIPPRDRDDNTRFVEIHTGTQSGERFNDTYSVSLGDGSDVSDLVPFLGSITIFRPFEAFIQEDENEYRLDAYDRQNATPGFVVPAIIRGFHYLDEEMADSIGGIEYCLEAPAWDVQEFCEGVLIRLVPGLFDPDNPEHLRIQMQAMEYFGLL